jgi:ABC-2 type transport system permease protein
MQAFSTLLGVELRLSLRDMNMPIFAVALPVVVICIIGMIFDGQPAFEGAPYTFVDQSVSAVAALGLCAGGAMGLPLMVSSSRQRKVFKRFYVTPVGVGMILGVQVALYAIYAVLSVVLVFAVAMLFFGYHLIGSVLPFVGAFALAMAAMFGIGLLVGGLAPHERSASLAASLLYFSMLLLSGTTIPYEMLPRPVQLVADVLPLTQGIKLMKATSLGLSVEQAMIPIIVLAAWAVVCSALAWRFFRWE